MELSNTGKRNKSYEVEGKQWELRLYIAGTSPNSMEAIRNLDHICATHLNRDYHIEVVDLLESPKLASADQILAIPTLVRRFPPPQKKIIGNLSDLERVLVGLDVPSEEFSS